ncbi:Adaptive-response sensory-kinase SasA [bioreactor metagenome]|uniref:histidine kinase n=1 Tax=bioreactor metagenome TaxID=1076179 RepID=A0A644ZJ78_9ZZZZ
MKILKRTNIRDPFQLLLLFPLIVGILFILVSHHQQTTPPPVTAIKEISVVIDDNYPPYAFRDADGVLQGFSIDEWKLWEMKTGIKVNITGTSWAKALAGAENGQYDVIDTLFYTTSRSRTFDFTKSYADINTNIYFSQNISGIHDLDSLRGFTIGVKSGDAIISNLINHGIENIVEYDSYQAIIQAAANSEIVVFAMDQPPAGYYLNLYNLTNDFNQTDPISSGQFHRAVLKGHQYLLELINNGFDSISKSEHQAITRKWFGIHTLDPKYIEYGAIALGVCLLVLFLLSLWSYSLRTRVDYKTKDLQASEARFRSLFDNSPISIWEEDFSLVKAEINTLKGHGVTDLDVYLTEHPDMVFRLASLVRIKNVNRVSLELFGAKSKEELLSSLAPLINHDAWGSIKEQLLHVQSGTSNFVTETINNTLSGGILYLELSWTIMPGHEEDLSSVIVSLVDITERKRVENEIKQLNLELEERIQRRTLELERSNKDLESFSYSVSHDLRAPLRAINGYAQIIVNDLAPKVDGDVLRYVEAISKNANNMGELIDALLSFSRMGQRALTLQTISIDSIIQNVLEELAPETRNRNIEFILHPMPDVQADAVLTKEILLNLIGNAVKFTRKVPRAVIEIGTTESKPEYPCGEETRLRQCFYVRDNGVGFNMNYYDKLFNMFQRLHSAQEYEGTGVGLALVKRIILKHGGSIWAESEVGKGTTFYFTLGKAN